MDASPTTAPAPADVLGPAGARTPFRCSGRAATYVDALEALALRGGWQPVVDDVALRCAVLAAYDVETRSRLDAAVGSEETALRRRLRLTSADDYLAWLRSWDLDVPDCREHLRRRALPLPSEPPPRGEAPPVALRAHVVIDGVLDDAVRRLAEDAALSGADPASSTWLDDVVRSAQSVRAAEPDELAVAELVAEHKVDWTRLRATVVVSTDDDVAHELLLCVHEQNAPLADVAAGAGLRTEDLDTTLDQLEPWAETVLLGAEPGSLLGPVAHPSGRAVIQVVDRSTPSAVDDDVRRRAADELLRRRAALAMSAAVRWSDGA